MRRQQAFTLLELMIVVAILAVLAALLLPAILGGAAKAQEARVQTLFSALDMALAQFKDRFGLYPPSAITLREDGNYSADPAGQNLLRRLWPRILLAGDPGFEPAVWAAIDGNAGSTDTYPLDGAQCLVFFLGGLPDPNTGIGQGFSRDPQHPFRRLGAADTTTGAMGRDGPYYEFRPNDLIGSGAFRRLRDPLLNGQPIAYFSAYEGIGYQPGDCPPAVPYRTSATGYWNPSTYQLISAGADGRFGSGGIFSPTGTPLTGDDSDNLTNFHTGTLGTSVAP